MTLLPSQLSVKMNVANVYDLDWPLSFGLLITLATPLVLELPIASYRIDDLLVR